MWQQDNLHFAGAYSGNLRRPGGEFELTELHVEGIVGDVYLALAHVDGLCQQGHVTLEVHLQCYHVFLLRERVRERVTKLARFSKLLLVSLG